MSNLLRRAVNGLLANTPIGRYKRSRDSFLVTRELVRNDAPIVFDVGAHVGQTAARYRTLFPHALIHCFEPFPASFRALADAFRGDDRVVPHPFAISDAAGSAQLKINRSSQTNSLLRSDERASHYWGTGLLETDGEVTVETHALDDFCHANRIGHIDVLKIDVQGSEYAVLAGARDLLQRAAIDLLYLEMIVAPTYVGQRKLHEYLASLDALGYPLFDLFNLARRDGRLIQADGIFVSTTFLERHELERRRERPH
jgi:FkbM family methyltransferase